MRDRTKEVEKLKKQLQKLQDDKERQGSRDGTPSSDLDAGAASPSPRAESAAMVGAATPMITTSDWTGGVYVPAWAGQTPEPEPQPPLHSLSLQDAEHPLNYDGPSFFPALPGTHEFPAMASPPSMAAPAGGRSRAVSACSLSSPPLQHQHLRSNSNPPPCFAPRGVSPAPGAWAHPPAESHEGYDSLQVPISAPPMLAASPAGYDLYHDDAVLGLPQPDSFSLDEGQHARPMAYPSPPDTSDLHHGWTGYENSKPERARSASAASVALLFEQHQQQQHQQAQGEAAPPRALPDTNAPLLHLAVSGGHLDTLRFLLQRYDININGRNNQGYTAIQLAVMGGRTDMVALLLEHGADVNTEDPGEGDARLG